jgi:hypothetical protein
MGLVGGHHPQPRTGLNSNSSSSRNRGSCSRDRNLHTGVKGVYAWLWSETELQ